MKTKAAVLYEIGKPLQVEELLVPELHPGQVLVKIAYSGVCRSQLNEIRGLKGEDVFLPHTLGHEGSGIVERVGPGVRKVKSGDCVVLTWIKGNGSDVPSVQYKKEDGTVVNSGAIATFLTRAVISENRLVKISKDMPLREAALLGCAVPTGAGIIRNLARVQAGESIAIFGVGGIGLSALLAARMMNAEKIIAVDIFEYKLKQALQFGATHTINAKERNVLSEIMKITSRRGVDYAIEAVGKKESMEIAFRSVRDQGGLCILAGNLPYGELISLNPFDLIKGKRIVGTGGGETQPDRDIPLYVDLYLAGRLNLGGLITHTYRWEEINRALEHLEQGKVVRALIDMDMDRNKGES